MQTRARAEEILRAKKPRDLATVGEVALLTERAANAALKDAVQTMTALSKGLTDDLLKLQARVKALEER